MRSFLFGMITMLCLVVLIAFGLLTFGIMYEDVAYGPVSRDRPRAHPRARPPIPYDHRYGPGQTVDSHLLHQLRFPDNQANATDLISLASNSPKSVQYQLVREATPSNGTKTEMATPDVERCASRADCTLEARLVCSICGGAAGTAISETKVVKYDNVKGLSDPIIFSFTPVAVEKNGTGKAFAPPGRRPGVTLNFLINGIKSSSLHVCVDVDDSAYCVAESGQGDKSEVSNIIDEGTFQDDDELYDFDEGAASDPSAARVVLSTSTVVRPDDARRPVPAGASSSGTMIQVRDQTSSPLLLSATDVRLRLVQDTDRKISLQVNLFNGQLTQQIKRAIAADPSVDAAALRSKLQASSTGKIVFPVDTGIGNIDKLHDFLKRRYLEISCLASDDANFKGYIAIVTRCSGEQGITNKSLGDVGKKLSAMLFAKDSGSRALFRVLARFAEARFSQTPDAPPIKISFRSDSNIHFPLQLVKHADMGGEFFGFLFDLATDGDDDLPAQLATTRGVFKNPVLGIFTDGEKVSESTSCAQKFQPDVNHNKSVERGACMHFQSIAKILRKKFNSDPLTPTVRKVDFVGRPTGMLGRSNSTELVWYYGHALSRINWPTRPVGDGTQDVVPVSPEEVLTSFGTAIEAIPRLKFGNAGGELLPASAIADLGDDGSDSKLFSRNPLVVLIACEGGTSIGGDATTMPQAFFHLGARGVVVSEAELSAAVGSEFAERFLDLMAPPSVASAGQVRFGGGMAASTAMLLARRALNDANRDKGAWSLLLYYAGNHE